MRNRERKKIQGLTIVEFMIATGIGLLLSLALIKMYYTQIQIYKTSNAQTLVQTTQNAIEYLVLPTIRNAGFMGCSTVSTTLSNLNGGGVKPLGTLNTTPAMIMGYNGGTGNITLSANPANNSTASNWSPSLDPSLTGKLQRWSDVLIVLGPPADDFPVSVNSISTSSSTLTVGSLNGMTISTGSFGAVSDCAKSILFQITGISGASITHNASSGAFGNSKSNISVNFAPGAQFIPIQQSAFFVAQGDGGQSSLMLAVLNGNTWSVQPIIPGVTLMKILYGIGSNGVVSQYTTAGNVTNWSNVYAIKIGFLFEGALGSGSPQANPTQFNLLGSLVTVPSDTRLRRTLEMTISLRNAGL